MDTVKDIAEKTAPIFKKYGFRKVGVFGSRARGDFRADSDFDFLYSTGGTPLSYTAKIAAEEDLQKTLGAEVDLVDDTHVIARMRPRIKKELQVIYEG